MHHKLKKTVTKGLKESLRRLDTTPFGLQKTIKEKSSKKPRQSLANFLGQESDESPRPTLKNNVNRGTV